MNLKLHLLVRMTLVGLLCWLGVSVYLIGESGRRAAHELVRNADQLQPIVTADVMRRWISLDSDKRYPDLAGAAARFPEPMCLRYRASDGSGSDWGCGPSPIGSGVPYWIARLLRSLGPGHISIRRPITAYGLQVGMLAVESDDAGLLRHQWRSVRELLGLTALTLLLLDVLAFWVVGRALRPTAKIVAAVEQLGEGAVGVHLTAFHPREFTLIAGGINRLAARLQEASSERAALSARLFRLQEDERRELAHELHEEFGQCVSALGAVSASLRQSVMMGEVVSEADVMPLEVAVEAMLSSLRGLLQRMSQPPLEGQGLRSALSDLVTGWRSRHHGGTRITFDADEASGNIASNECALCVYRIVQEALSNIARHAPASGNVRVQVRQESRRLLLRICNDLGGPTHGRSVPSSGMGLKLLGERVRSLGGTFSVEPSETQFVLSASLPLGAP